MMKNNSRGCEDHENSLGLFRVALGDEIRLNENPIVRLVLVVGEMALGMGMGSGYLTIPFIVLN
jgi:hypothetical protein